MSRPSSRLERDISLWVSGEAAEVASARVVAALADNGSARKSAAAALAVEDLVRDWYGGIPLPPLSPLFMARRRRRSLVSAVLASVAMLLIPVGMAARPEVLEQAARTTAAWMTSGARLQLENGSYWRLRRSAEMRSEW